MLKVLCFIMKHICLWSGGKDSTATIILAHLMGEPLDEIVISEVMYCNERGISGENPEHMRFVKEVAKPLFEKWGYEVKILHAEKDFLSCFHHTIERATKYTSHNGMKYGFPISKLCSIKRDCKIKPMNDYLRSMEGDYLEYMGICIDEPLRLMSMHRKNNSISLLEKYGYTEQMARELCERYGLLSPLYRFSDKQNRQGCWFCPNAKPEEHLYIMKHMPEIWQEYVSLENEDVAFAKWNTFTDETLHQRSEKLELKFKGGVAV